MSGALKTAQRAKVAKTGYLEAKPLKEMPMWVPEDTWQRISDEAYKLYELRGRREGHALQDWLDAENIVLGQIFELHQ
jgi:Protein of unknown function (DUF2934)